MTRRSGDADHQQHAWHGRQGGWADTPDAWEPSVWFGPLGGKWIDFRPGLEATVKSKGIALEQHLTAILPCNDIDAAEAFFIRLGFTRVTGSLDEYRMLFDGRGGFIHLQPAVEGWLVPGRNPFGLYLYREDVDGTAAAFAGEIIGKDGPSAKPWGMYEFALNGPDDVLVRVGWPTRLR
jgi:hypothetical protein